MEKKEIEITEYNLEDILRKLFEYYMMDYRFTHWREFQTSNNEILLLGILFLRNKAILRIDDEIHKSSIITFEHIGIINGDKYILHGGSLNRVKEAGIELRLLKQVKNQEELDRRVINHDQPFYNIEPKTIKMDFFKRNNKLRPKAKQKPNTAKLKSSLTKTKKNTISYNFSDEVI